MKGYVAVQKKLLCLIYALWKKDEAYDPHYHPRGSERASDGQPALITAEQEAINPCAKEPIPAVEHSEAVAVDSLSVDAAGIQNKARQQPRASQYASGNTHTRLLLEPEDLKKPNPKGLTSLDEHSSAHAVSSLSVSQN